MEGGRSRRGFWPNARFPASERSPSVTIASVLPWRLSAFFMKAKAAALSRVLVTKAAHVVDPATPDFHFRGEHRTKAIPPEPHCLVANIDAAFEQ
jgi:hypothetical protein